MIQKKAFTLIEMIFVVLISGILAVGTFKALEALYTRSAKAKAVTDLSLRSQIVLDQIGVMLYNRIPNSVIGWDPTSSTCEAITDITSSKPVLEWLGTMDDELIERKYDGFVDMQKSDKNNEILDTPDINSSLNNSDINLIFSGAFDSGDESMKACEGAFGYHGHDSNLSFKVTIGDNNITLTDSVKPKYIYEKYYLTKTAYAITRGENIDHTKFDNNCHRSDINTSASDFNNTLFLFYNYQPYKGETYCGDGGDGNVSILAKDVSGFAVLYENDALRLKLDMTKDIRGSTPVHITKEKVIF